MINGHRFNSTGKGGCCTYCELPIESAEILGCGVYDAWGDDVDSDSETIDDSDR